MLGILNLLPVSEEGLFFSPKQVRDQEALLSSTPECVCVDPDLSPALSAVESGLALQDWTGLNE